MARSNFKKFLTLFGVGCGLIIAHSDSRFFIQQIRSHNDLLPYLGYSLCVISSGYLFSLAQKTISSSSSSSSILLGSSSSSSMS